MKIYKDAKTKFYFLLVLLIISSVASFSLAANLSEKNKSETYKDIIEKAQNLILQKNRAQALDILKNAAQREQNLNAVKELKKTAIEIANIFMTEKTHQLYENALSLRFTNISDAMNRVNEALKVEPNNMMLMTELGRLMIAKKDCKAAESNAFAMSELIPFYEKVDLSLAQAYLCSSNWENYKKVVSPLNLKKSEDRYAWEILEFHHALQTNQLLLAQQSLKSLSEIYPDYPEVPYLRWKMSVARQKPDNEQGQKYLHTCKNITMGLYRKYISDSTLCRNVLEVETDMKGLLNVAE